MAISFGDKTLLSDKRPEISSYCWHTQEAREGSRGARNLSFDEEATVERRKPWVAIKKGRDRF